MNNAANLKAFRLRQSFERSRTFPRTGAAAGREDMRVGIIGIGMTAFRPSTPEYNWKEVMFEAASRAYADAAINPREDVDSFFFFQAEDGIRDLTVTGVQTCALPI